MDNIDNIKILGGKRLSGTVEVYGAKNVVSKLIVASLLTSKPCIIRNVSYVVDTELMLGAVRAMGGEVESVGERAIKITTANMHPMSTTELTELSGKSRIPILLCGPLLTRLGEVTIPVLGGCKIGDRPVDFHLEALEKLGAKTEERSDGLYLKAKRLRGCEIHFEYPSVGATEQVLLAGVLAEGTTVLHNAAIEPEIIDLVVTLEEMGAKISKIGERTFQITGVDSLHGFDHAAIPDRLEVASWAAAAVATNGEVFVKNAREDHLQSFLTKYKSLGGDYRAMDDGINFWRGNETLSATNIETDVYPGFATDWQQPFVICLTQAVGTSTVHETVYENRFGYTETLVKMGADIKLSKECLGKKCRFTNQYLHLATITGPTPLQARDIEIPDLRGGFSYVIAALVAQATSNIRNVKILSRGYEGFIAKLQALGVNVVS